MNTQKHLQRIKAKCQKLLAIAEKRTAGEWRVFPSYRVNELSGLCVAEMESMTSDERDRNADFIASCAGAAEAGWRATIAAIEILPALDRIESGRLADEIIAAWPEELLLTA
jgi:hypothetical protein